MPFQEPGLFEVQFTLFLGKTLISSQYKQYVDELDLRGDEVMLDYGSGSGVCSRFLAQRLLEGGGHLTCMDVSCVWIEVIKKTLKNFPNVDYRCGETMHLDINDDSFDALFIHFVLHDIEHAERPEIVKHLLATLKRGVKLFLREPTDRGIPVEEIRHLMALNQLEEISHTISHTWFTGPLYQGVYVKK